MDRKTFTKIADKAFVTALREDSECQRRDVVFDVYREVAIKQDERVNRGEDAGTELNNVAPSHQI